MQMTLAFGPDGMPIGVVHAAFLPPSAAKEPGTRGD